MRYLKLFENFNNLVDQIKDQNINIEEALKKAASVDSLGKYFTFHFNTKDLTLRVDHNYVYPGGDKNTGLSQLGNSLDRILSTATENLESMGLQLPEGDDTSHGKNAFSCISDPFKSQSQVWFYKIYI